MARAFIGVGSNIDPENNVLAAVCSLAQRVHVAGVSMVYRSEAIDRPEQPQYFNCVVEIETDIPPLEIKCGILRPIEDKLGRVRMGDKYAPRTIDLDLIAYGQLTVNTADIRLPDPQILVRPFLAVPLFELAPDMVLPGVNLGVSEVAARLSRDGMEPLEAYTQKLREAVLRAAISLPDFRC